MNCPANHKHARSLNCYDTHKCRCEPCRAWNSETTRLRRRLKAYGTYDGSLVNARGTQRRIQGLQLLGFTFDQIGEAAGVNRNTVWRVLNERTVEPKTRDRISRAYKELLRNPTGGASTRTASMAKAKGYVSPYAWDDIDADYRPDWVADLGGVDTVAVDLAVSGVRVKLTSDERRAAVTRLHADRWSDALIAETLHCASETVQRDRKRLGLPTYPYDELVKRDVA